MNDSRFQAANEFKPDPPLGELIAVFETSRVRTAWLLISFSGVAGLLFLIPFAYLNELFSGQNPVLTRENVCYMPMFLAFLVVFSSVIPAVAAFNTWRARSWCLAIYSDGFIQFTPPKYVLDFTPFRPMELETIRWTELTELVETRHVGSAVQLMATVVRGIRVIKVDPPAVDATSRQKLFNLLSQAARKHDVPIRVEIYEPPPG